MEKVEENNWIFRIYDSKGWYCFGLKNGHETFRHTNWEEFPDDHDYANDNSGWKSLSQLLDYTSRYRYITEIKLSNIWKM